MSHIAATIAPRFTDYLNLAHTPGIGFTERDSGMAGASISVVLNW